ncbi:Methylglutaconyl-CoA hydratase [Chlorella vulgaris]
MLAALVPRLGGFASYPVPSIVASTALRNFSAAAVTTDNSLQVVLEPLDGIDEGIFLLSLSRPAARNSIGRQLLRELRECLYTVAQERTTRCVVVRSTVPGVFCAGADLKERAGMTQMEAATFVRELREAFAQLDSLPMPTVACVDGYALGGGAELALACDLRVCGRDAQFAFPETRLGIIPGAGGTQRLPRIIGKRIDMHDALRIGLADHAADDSPAEDVALRVAREIAQGGPVALRLAKQAISLGLEVDLHSGMKMEEACYAQVIPTRDRLEGLAAFAEKRQPKFTGE